MAIYSYKPNTNYLLEDTNLPIESINEAYFGSNNKELNALQEQFSVFRQKWMHKSIYSKSINTDPELQKFNRMCEDFFGFEAFALVIDPEASKNAYTFPLSNKLDVGNTSNHLIVTKNGFKYKKEVGYSCMVFLHSGFLVDGDFSDREVFAIILHEIGHNFQQNFNQLCTVAGILNKLLVLVTLPINIIIGILNPLGSNAKSVVNSTNAINKMVINKADSLKRNNPNFVEATYLLKNVGSLVNNVLMNGILTLSYVTFVLNPFGSILSIIYDKIRSIFKNDPLTIVRSLLGYKGEKVSDEFATIYGYGADLSSALEKMEYENKTGIMAQDIFTSLPFINNLYDMFILPFEYLLDPFEPHPETVSRAQNQLKVLEKELTKNGIDPRMKAQIKKDIDELNSVIKKMTVPQTDDPNSIKKAYSAFMLKTCGGDIRELFSKNKPIGDFDKYENNPVKNIKFK